VKTESFYVPRFEIRISGLSLTADITDHVLSITIETDLDLAGSFGITLRNADNQFLDSSLFDLGKTVEIHLGYGNELYPAFLGELTSIEPSFPESGASVVRISGYDKSYKMRRAQSGLKDYSFMNDSLIAAQIAVENGLVPLVDPTPMFKQKVTQTESDMAFLKSRASRYFFDVYVEWDRLHFQFPRPQMQAYVLEWGRNLSSFSPRISAAGLAGIQVIRGYNQELAQTIVSMAMAADLDVDNIVERLGSSAMDLLQSLVRRGIYKEAVENPLEAAMLAKSILQNILEGMYEGTGACIGLPQLQAGEYISIKGVGKRFSGTYRLRKVTHTIDGNGYRTDFGITQRGHSNLLGMLRQQVIEEPSPNEAHRFYGVVVGEVQRSETDASTPSSLGAANVSRGDVKVSFPGLSEKISDWAHCAMPMTGTDMGFFARPEPGTQVLVAFEQGQLSKPYVIGSLWNATQSPPAAVKGKENDIRVIRSRAGHSIMFDDTTDQAKLVIEGGGSSIRLDAKTGDVTISATGNLILKSEGTISLEAAKGQTKIIMNATEVNVT
jgi:phage protein D